MFVGFRIVTVLTIKNIIFFDVTPSVLIEVYRDVLERKVFFFSLLLAVAWFTLLLL
jgi:hypothetical protein